MSETLHQRYSRLMPRAMRAAERGGKGRWWSFLIGIRFYRWWSLQKGSQPIPAQ